MTTRVSLRWLGWVPIAVVLNNHFYTLQLVTGRSMQPTLNPDSSAWRDTALFDRTVAIKGYKCKRGDIVSLSSPVAPKTYLVKRIIALEGDLVQTLTYPEPEVIVPQGYAWVEGDERYHSQDSNYFGPVPLALINAKLAFIVWPPSRFGPLRCPSTDSGSLGPLHSPTWKERHSEVAREQWRLARVRTAQQRMPSVE
ncbi:peptidase S24/S26A/S26B/S26C [Gautieria morchelliformis]|nr:peptidase S24/S26A/S26B/S26C [Gautieria morchelliformis]